jgi:hypothetical protein
MVLNLFRERIIMLKKIEKKEKEKAERMHSKDKIKEKIIKEKIAFDSRSVSSKKNILYTSARDEPNREIRYLRLVI